MAATPLNDSVQASNYKQYENDNTYHYEPGVLVVPRIGNTPRAIQVHQPYSVRKQSFLAIKDRTPPVVPAPQTGAILLGQDVQVALPKLASANPPMYTFGISGNYSYLDTSPINPSLSGGYPGGSYPMAFPAMIQMAQQMNALGGVLGGSIFAGTNQLFQLSPETIQSGAYAWPFASISASFFDPFLSGNPISTS